MGRCCVIRNNLPAFWETSRAIDLEDQLKILAKDVAKIIENAPPFQPDWPLIRCAEVVSKPHIDLERL